MSTNWAKDISEMHEKYGVQNWVQDQLNSDNQEKLLKFLEFRIRFLEEELSETKNAITQHDASEVVDGLIDLCVVAIGTLDAFGVDANEAWDRVLAANMNKEVGVKESRPNELGLPDLIKPIDWAAPVHDDNTGHLSNSFL